MAYGHAERNLALIRQLEAETEDLLGTLKEPDPEQSAAEQLADTRDDLVAVKLDIGHELFVG
jgi:hypothetical protein